VFLDEPITGLDPVGRREIRRIIMRIKERGKTVFFCSHVLHDVELMCDEIGILCDGKLIMSGKLNDLLAAKETVISTRGLSQDAIEELKKRDVSLSLKGDEVKAVVNGKSEAEDVIKMIESRGRNVTVERHRETLEELFMKEVEKVKGRGGK